MPRRILFLTNTYFQLIVAIQLRRTVLKDTEADIVVTNHSAGCEAICSRLSDSGLFRKVFFVRQKSRELQPGLLRRLCYFLPYGLFREKMLKQAADLPDDYEEIWFNNAITLTHLVWRHCPKARLCRFEEGYGTYTKPLVEKKTVRYLFRLFFGDIEKKLDRLYLFHPELYFAPETVPVYQIPILQRDDGELRCLLNRIFDYRPQEEFADCTYVFLEESFRLDGEAVPDVELIGRIAEALGRDKLIVKRHPRSNDDPYTAMGIKTIRSMDRIPWEVIQMNQCLQGKKLISISSGSILASVLYFQEEIPSYLLFRCIPVKPHVVNDVYEKYLAALRQKAGWLCVPDSFQEFLRMIDPKSGS